MEGSFASSLLCVSRRHSARISNSAQARLLLVELCRGILSLQRRLDRYLAGDRVRVKMRLAIFRKNIRD